MSSLPDRVDVVIIGAGTAGAAAAFHLARRGMSALCLDRRPLDGAGAHWVNSVAVNLFEEAAIPLPEGDEIVGGNRPFYLFAGWGPRRIELDSHGAPELDMRKLVARLQGLAAGAGATLVGGVRVEAVDETQVHTTEGSVRSRWVVDASGLAGLRLLGPPRVPARDLCSAAQSSFRLADDAAARAFWAERDASFGDNLCFAGVAGGYSILNVHVHHDEVGILTGTIPGEGNVSGTALLRSFVERHDWIGEEIHGGSRAIPVRRPFDRLTDGRVIAIGDAASQVFPAHGSGIGAGMIAARKLADALADGRGAHGFAAEWMRTEGGKFASYDVFRRFTQRTGEADLETLLRTGLMDQVTAKAAKLQVAPDFPPAVIPAKLRGLAQAGGLGARVVATVAKMELTKALYRRYPEDPSKLPAWSRAAGFLFGDPPDVTGALPSRPRYEPAPTTDDRPSARPN